MSSPLMSSVIISSAIALFAVLTRPSPSFEVERESSLAYFLKIFIISFVCTYFGGMLLISQSIPEIHTGEPDF